MVTLLGLGLVCYNKQTNHRVNKLVGLNVEALTQDESSSFRYPEKSGSAVFCTLYVYKKGGIVVGKSSSEIPEYEASAEYTKISSEGLKDRCPDKGKGCNPYSCQEVPY